MLTVTLLVCAAVALAAPVAVLEASPAPETGPSNHEEENLLMERNTFCPSGWTMANGRCLRYVPTPRSWAQAETNCQFLGGNLVSVHSLDEYHLIQGVILRETSSYPVTWIGGSDAEEEGTWFWSDGTLFQYPYWAPGQPDNLSSSNCMVMNFGDLKKFDDQPCYAARPFVCARKP